MIHDREVAEICWAAHRKLMETQGQAPLPGWEALPPRRQDLMTETIRLARCGARPEQLFLLWHDHQPSTGWAELAMADRIAWQAMQIMALALSLDC